MAIVQAFTIIDRRTSEPFVLRFRQRPAAVAFRAHSHARLTARAIERRESVAGTMAEYYDLVPADESDEEPEFHFLKAWESYDALVEACRESSLDLMFCTHVTAVQGVSIEFSGHVQVTEEEDE